jgi:hypothetical protein
MKRAKHILRIGLVLAGFTGLFAPRIALSAEPTPPKLLEDAVHACAKSKAGDACNVTISQHDNSGVCVVFTQGALVCAIDALP